jgi:hypothetical protein
MVLDCAPIAPGRASLIQVKHHEQHHEGEHGTGAE